jgi:hypothetical protein
LFSRSDGLYSLDCTSCKLNSGLVELLSYHISSLETFFAGQVTLQKVADKRLQSTIKFDAVLQSCVLKVLIGTTRTLQVRQRASSRSFCRTIVQSGSILS